MVLQEIITVYLLYVHASFVCIEYAHLMCMKRASASLKLKLQIIVNNLVVVGNRVEIL